MTSMAATWTACAAACLVGCGAPGGAGAAPETAAAPNATSAPAGGAGARPTDCPWRLYHAPPGCYVDDDSLRDSLTIADPGALAGVLRRLPADPHVQHPPCDPAAQSAAFDFAHGQVFLCRVPGSGPHPEPIGVACRDGTTRVSVQSQAAAQCGRGDDIGTSVMMLVVPAGSPVELVQEGDCDFDPGLTPPP